MWRVAVEVDAVEVEVEVDAVEVEVEEETRSLDRGHQTRLRGNKNAGIKEIGRGGNENGASPNTWQRHYMINGGHISRIWTTWILRWWYIHRTWNCNTSLRIHPSRCRSSPAPDPALILLLILLLLLLLPYRTARLPRTVPPVDYTVDVVEDDDEIVERNSNRKMKASSNIMHGGTYGTLYVMHDLKTSF